MFQGLILGNTFASGATIGVRIVAAELFERFTFRTDVLVVLGVPFEVGARPSAVGPTSFIQHRNVGIDFAINEPAKHRP